MFIALALAVGLSPIQFKGGSPTDLISAIANATKTNAMIVYSKHYHLKPMTIDVQKTSDAYSEISEKTPFGFIGGGKYLLHDKVYPEEWFLRLTNAYVPSPRATATGLDKMDKDGLITWNSQKHGAIKVGDLTKVKWKHPLTIFWLFRPMALAAVVTNEPEKKFLNHLAEVLGGDFIDDGESYSIQPDWTPVYSRVDRTATAMIARDTKIPKRWTLNRELWLGIYHDIGENYVSEFLQSPNDQKTLMVGAGSPFASTVYDFLVQVKQISGNRYSVLNRYNPKYPVKVLISQDGTIQVQVPVYMPRSRSIQYRPI